MKKLLLFLVLNAFLFSLGAQSTQTISTGAGYKKQSFVNLTTGTETQVDATKWDIAFTVYGQQDAGIHINEGNGSSMGTPLPVIQIYDLFTDNFADQPDPANYVDFELFNDEKSWAYGAFNEGRDLANPFDFGWGVYNPAAFKVTGTKVFLVKLRDNTYKKIQFQSLAGAPGTYTFRYANLDGTGETTVTINKADHVGKTMAYFSFTTGATVDVEPSTGFDLIYCRYISPVYDPGTMTNIPVNVTGILHAKGYKTAEADNVDPLTVQYASYVDSLSSQVDKIGYDWKTFTGAAWTLDTDRAFFLKSPQSHVWKIVFTGFGGSTTGTATFTKEDLGIISGVDNLQFANLEVLTYPNPTTERLYIALDIPLENASNGMLNVSDMQGRTIVNSSVSLHDGFQVMELSSQSWAAGQYQVQLFLNGKVLDLGKVIKN